jgi:hypothetical protein
LILVAGRWYVLQIKEELSASSRATANVSILANAGVTGSDNVMTWASGEGSVSPIGISTHPRPRQDSQPVGGVGATLLRRRANRVLRTVIQQREGAY